MKKSELLQQLSQVAGTDPEIMIHADTGQTLTVHGVQEPSPTSGRKGGEVYLQARLHKLPGTQPPAGKGAKKPENKAAAARPQPTTHR